MHTRRNRAGLLRFAVLSVTLSSSGLTGPMLGIASPQTAYEPPTWTGESISLLEAIRVTLEHEPNIRLQQENAQRQQGAAQEATGQFDATVVGKLRYDYLQDELRDQVKTRLVKERLDIGKARDQALDIEIEAGRRAAEYATARQGIENGDDLRSIRFVDPFDQASWNVLTAFHYRIDPEVLGEVDDAIKLYLDTQREAAGQAEAVARENRVDAEKALRKLGLVPDAEKNYGASLNLELRKQFRSGPTLTPFLQLGGDGINYLGKGTSAEFGGQGPADLYKTALGFRVDVPLGRGWGVGATGAGERAARIQYDASVASADHTASTSVEQAMLAYWKLVGAQGRFAVLEQSLSLNRRLLEISRNMVAAHELPGAELARAQGREAEARAQVQEARRSLHQARVNLATTIGLRLDNLAQAPAAADSFPAGPGEAERTALDAKALAVAALGSRFDYQAASRLQEAEGVLYDASRFDLRRQTDLKVELSAGSQDENSNLAQGVAAAVGSKWNGPSAKLSLTSGWPIGNNAQLGRLEQQEAAFNQQRITVRDLERRIRSNVVLTVGLLQEAANQLKEYTEAVQFYGQSVDSEMQKFRMKEATLIDTITTEQRRLDAQLAYVASQQRVAELLTQLRFETGTLVAEQPEGGLTIQPDLLTLPAAPGAGPR